MTMLRSIQANNFLLRFQNFRNFRPFLRCSRTFLSASYNCTEAWNSRHESSLLRKVNPRDLFFELDQKLQNTGKISAVDVDILLNSVKDPDLVDEIINIIHQLRLTAETSHTLESTHHAFIRFLMDCGQEELLCEILHDRLNYGIFPDHFCYNLMMDKFINQKNFASAAKIATLLMLQEESEHSLSNALAIYSCYKYMESPDQWTLPPPTIVDPKEEVIKVRVRYLRNPFFDDHFDLVEPKQLVGKALVFFGKLINDPLGRTCQLRGYILWSKYECAVKAIKNWIDQDFNEIVYEEVLSTIEKDISDISEDNITNNVKELKIQLGKLKNVGLKAGSVIEEMEERLHDAVAQKETADIINQCQSYKEWEDIRMNLLKKQIDELEKEKRLENAEKMKRDLQERERLLTFFENEEDIELRIEQKLAFEDEKYGPPVQIKADIEENYVPPEITKQNMFTRK